MADGSEMTDEEFRKKFAQQAQGVPVNDEGIPIFSGPSALSQELGIDTPKYPAQANVSAFPNFAHDAKNYIVNGPDKAIAEAKARNDFVGPPSPAVDAVPPMLARDGTPAIAAQTPQSAMPTSYPSQQGAPYQQAPGASQRMPGGGSIYDRLGNVSNLSTTETLKGLADNQRNLYQAIEDKNKAIQAEAENQAKVNADVARIHQGYMDDARELQAQNEIKEQNRQQDLQIEVNKYENIKNDFMNSKVNPDKVWDKGVFGSPTANKVFAAIAMGLQGFAGRSDVVNMINDSINREIAVQNSAIERKGQGANMQQYIVGQYRDAFRNQVQADLAAKLAMQERANDMIEQRKLNARSQTELNNATQMQQDLKIDFGKTYQQFLQASNAVVVQGVGQQANLANLKSEQSYRNEMLDLKARQAQGTSSKLFVPGAGYATDEDSAKKARDAMQVQNSLDGNLRDLIALRQQHGGGFTLDRKDVARAEIIKEQVKRKLQKLYEMGVLQQYEEKSIDKMLPDADTYSPMGSVDSAYQQLMTSTRADTNRKVQEYMNPALSYGTPRYDSVQETVVKPPPK